ncbi:Laminin subunit gamma-3 [Varanus komodoensis]|nr:Laminin subunit gamma-3 [Varanus komodoensis]
MTLLLSSLALVLLDLHLSMGAMDSCYDTEGRPQRCMPIFENTAFGRPAQVSNTCGSPPEDFCLQMGTRDSTSLCHRCDASDAALHHNATYLTDFHSQEEPTWWQSQSMAFGVQYPNSVNITLRLVRQASSRRCGSSNVLPARCLTPQRAERKRAWVQWAELRKSNDVPHANQMPHTSIARHSPPIQKLNPESPEGKSYEITYVRLKFHTSRPESFAIYKRSRADGPWIPYQYYSASCRKTYGRPERQFLRPGEDEQVAFCTDEFSDISPLSGGNVAFSTLEGRPSAYSFDQSSALQVQASAWMNGHLTVEGQADSLGLAGPAASWCPGLGWL